MFASRSNAAPSPNLAKSLKCQKLTFGHYCFADALYCGSIRHVRLLKMRCPTLSRNGASGAPFAAT
jgi:hypothetical protein